MDCYTKFGPECYIVRDVVFGNGESYYLEWLPHDKDEDNFKHFKSLQDATKAADEMHCMERGTASNCFISTRETCKIWKESWTKSRNYFKWSVNNQRRLDGQRPLK